MMPGNRVVPRDSRGVGSGLAGSTWGKVGIKIEGEVCLRVCSPRRVLYDASRKGGATVSKTFMRRLVWRDLAYWQLHHWPSMPKEPIRPQYALQVGSCRFERMHKQCRFQLFYELN